MIDLPEIGKEYSWQHILAIAHQLGINDVVRILDNHPPPDKPFHSDGCSCCPDAWRGVSILPRCIIHDIRYWCGLPGDELARLNADIDLMRGVANDTDDFYFARAMFAGVSAGGSDRLAGIGGIAPWRWGFGRNK